LKLYIYAATVDEHVSSPFSLCTPLCPSMCERCSKFRMSKVCYIGVFISCISPSEMMGNYLLRLISLVLVLHRPPPLLFFLFLLFFLLLLFLLLLLLVLLLFALVLLLLLAFVLHLFSSSSPLSPLFLPHSSAFLLVSCLPHLCIPFFFILISSSRFLFLSSFLSSCSCPSFASPYRAVFRSRTDIGRCIASVTI